jgi:hypothetical protein
LLCTIHEIGTASWDRPRLLARYGLGVWHKRSLSRAFCHARMLLGRRMIAAGIDDGELGAKVAALDERTSWAERDGLLAQLAAAALEEDAPLPGADAEYRRAREALTALQAHEARLLAVKALLRGSVCWWWLTIGYGAFGCFVFLAVAKALGWVLS